ncbi:MAG: sulfite exporter TauE/SafE family protein [Deltaproteobacteria bacterium]|nr:sulfite exporter TauE/SafE family protein [Deltaproteobacteria bacterium]MBW2362635.1 sulfite exporter TauE/SafE family protein [Deltaproteobacteria bacterium]
METLGVAQAALLVGGGFVAGIVNTLAGGGSLLTVPLLVLLGLPGTLANGTNRVGIVFQCCVAMWHFRSRGLLDLREVLPVFLPVALGSVLGATLIARVADTTFERAFGVVMLCLLVPLLRGNPARKPSQPTRHGRTLTTLLYFGIGLYAGAFQAGVGVPLLFALLYAGNDLLRANALKVAVIALATGVAVPVFVVAGQVAWAPALLLAAGFSAGGALGARLAIESGERLVRPFLLVAIVALSAHMLGLF